MTVGIGRKEGNQDLEDVNRTLMEQLTPHPPTPPVTYMNMSRTRTMKF